MPVEVKNPYAETGYSGTINNGGVIDTLDDASAWQGQTAFETVRKMRNDAIISAVEKGIFLPIKKAEIQMYYNDPKLINDPIHLKALEFVKQNLENIPDWRTDALSCIPNGVSVLEKVYQYKDNQITLKKLAPRLPETIYYWYTDQHGKLESIEQHVYLPNGEKFHGSWYREINIPASKLVVITHQKEGDNYLGKSEYRSLYREWFIKDFALRRTNVTIERVGIGIPVAIPRSEANPAQIEAIVNVMQGMKAKEGAYIVAPGLERVDLLKTDPGSISAIYTNMLPYFDQAIAKSAYQMIINMGTTASGSRSLGESFTDRFLDAVEGITWEISDAINSQLIPELCDYNFRGLKEYPKMSFIIKRDMSAMLPILATLKSAGFEVDNKDVGNVILNTVGLPETTPTNKKPIVVPEQVINNTQVLADKCSHSHIQMADISSWTMRREMTEAEKASGVQFADIAKQIDAIKTVMSKEIRHAAEKEIKKMAALTKEKKIYQINPQWGNVITDIMVKYYKKIAALAKENIKSEAAKQGKKLNDTLKFADNFDDWIREQAGINSEILSAEVKKAFIQYYKAGLAQGLSSDALESFIWDSFEQEVGQRYDTASEEVVKAYGNARELTAQEVEGITSKIRTEIFDNNICDVCKSEDGKVYTLTDGEWIGEDGKPETEGPPFVDCTGTQNGNSCRGLYIYQWGEK